MKKLLLCIISPLVLVLCLLPLNPLASSLQNLPSTESSKHWKVVIGKPDSSDSRLNKSSRPDLYNVYSLDIQNIGSKEVKLVRVEAYRDEPNSSKEFELFTDDYYQQKSIQPSFHHENFPLHTKAKKLKVIVTWIEKSEGENVHKHSRKYREQFVFNQ